MITVLIVDDQAMVRQGSPHSSTRHDIRVVGDAGDGTTTVKAARELEPDVMLMDVRMPEMDGIEATRQIPQAQGDRTRVGDADHLRRRRVRR